MPLGHAVLGITALWVHSELTPRKTTQVAHVHSVTTVWRALVFQRPALQVPTQIPLGMWPPLIARLVQKVIKSLLSFVLTQADGS